MFSAAASPLEIPAVFPTPLRIDPTGSGVTLTQRHVRIVSEAALAPGVADLVGRTLARGGATSVVGSPEDPVSGSDIRLIVGRVGTQAVGRVLQGLRVEVPPDLPAEGYALVVDGRTAPATIVLAGAGDAGTYYAAQSLRQLLVRAEGEAALAGVLMVDRPALPIRGVLERFGGPPWDQARLLDLVAFMGDVKLNAMILAPRDDPAHGHGWREPLPPDGLARLAELARVAGARHVRLGYAVSAVARPTGEAASPPGGNDSTPICYGHAADASRLLVRFEALHGAGVRDVVLLFDEVDLDRWDCASDRELYGPAGPAGHARAQVDLANRLQRELVARLGEGSRLLLLPTQCADLADSEYKAELRGGWHGGLDPDVQVLWAGPSRFAAEVRPDQAEEAASGRVFGRPVVLADDFPSNDHPAADGRLLLAPYRKRDAGLSSRLAGLLASPMRQPGASKVPLFSIADFAWNDAAYRPGRSWRATAAYLAEGDATTTLALLTFFDLEYTAPAPGPGPQAGDSGRLQRLAARMWTRGSDRLPAIGRLQRAPTRYWLPQAPMLRRELDAFWRVTGEGDPAAALASIWPYADRIATAPAVIRAGVRDRVFLADVRPWLEAMEILGAALLAALEAQQARLDGDEARAETEAARAIDLVARAGRPEPGSEPGLPKAPIRVGDGVLDTFIGRLAGAG